jgi:hypothetical protein
MTHRRGVVADRSAHAGKTGKEVGMPPLSRERVDRIFENYLLALAGVDQCSESAPDDVKRRLAANADQAERAYTDATADGLADGSPGIDDEVRSLAQANERSRIALHDGRPIAVVLADLEQGTAHAFAVLKAALSSRL